MKVLVTGANGFVGSNLCKGLLEHGYEVRALVLPGTNEKNLAGLDVEIVQGNLLEPDSLKIAVENVDIIFHLAALVSDWGPRKLFMDVNFHGVKNILDMAVDAKVKRFVFMSSLAIHKFKGWNGADENTPRENCENPYSESKIASEDLCNEYFRNSKIETVIVRPGFVIFGPGDMMLFYRVAKTLEQGKIYGTINKGVAKFCYSYVENLVDGLILTGEHKKAAGETYIITDGGLTWNEFNESIACKLGVKPPSTSIPSWLAYPFVTILEYIYKLVKSKNAPLLTRYRVGVQAKDCFFVSYKIEKELGYQAKISLEEGLNRTINWYKKQSHNSNYSALVF